jgi:predicted acyl esterase
LPPETAAHLAGVVNQLNALAIQFDADKTERLSASEQEEMLKFVTEKFGAAWGERGRVFLKAADTNIDGEITLAEWKHAIDLLAKSAAKPRSSSTTSDSNSSKDPASDVSIETVMVEMSDGVHLATDVYLPRASKGPLPVIFSRTPYNRAKMENFARVQATHGYAVVSQDMRGRFGSEGENLPFIGCGWGVHQDGVESMAWIRKQTRCNGKIGTVGGSAGGITQNLLAGAAPEGLVCQHISVAPASMYHHASYVGGALRKCQVENWTRSNRFDSRALDITLAHPAFDDYWRENETTLKFAVMNTPAVHIGGWFDTFAQGTIDSFVGRQHHGGPGARGRQKLVMGPWTHAVGRTEPGAELTFPNIQLPEKYSTGPWFDHHLLGIENGVMSSPAVAYYVLGDTTDANAPGNEWRYADDWPIASQPTPYYFGKDGSLAAEKPRDQNGAVEYTFDPKSPCPTVGGNNLTIPRGPKNQNSIESRSDVVLFTTAPLAEPLEVTDRVTARVFVASSAVDSDLSVRLCDVYPDGRSFLIAEGMLRLRYRNSFEKPELLTPGQVVPVDVDCWSTSIVFNRGHRVRVTVTSSNHPRFDVNPGTGKPWVDGEPHVVQTNRILCSADGASHVLLPVVAAAPTKP